jgi:hypothetical protein
MRIVTLVGILIVEAFKDVKGMASWSGYLKLTSIPHCRELESLVGFITTACWQKVC